MSSREGNRGHDRRTRRTHLLLASSEQLYGALLSLYPKAFRSRYASEMRRDFRELSREGLEEGGGTELARVWASTLSDLLVTAIKERGTMPARGAYLAVDPRIVAKSMVAVVLVALAVTMASLSMIPQYEASNKVLIGTEDSAPSTLELQRQDLQEVTLTLAEATRSRPVAEDTIDRLGLSTTPGVFLQRLEAEPVKNTQFIEVSYTDQDPRRAQVVANTVVDVLSERVSKLDPSSNDPVRATLWERARIPEAPVSPNPLRNGLLVLVSGLLLSVSLAFALPKIAASGTGGAALPETRAVVSGPTNVSWGRTIGAPDTEGAKEKELLEALRRRGALTVAGVALETSLTVEEAERMLSALAAKGHLEVSVAHGRLLYSLWEGDTRL